MCYAGRSNEYKTDHNDLSKLSDEDLTSSFAYKFGRKLAKITTSKNIRLTARIGALDFSYREQSSLVQAETNINLYESGQKKMRDVAKKDNLEKIKQVKTTIKELQNSIRDFDNHADTNGVRISCKKLEQLEQCCDSLEREHDNILKSSDGFYGKHAKLIYYFFNDKGQMEELIEAKYPPLNQQNEKGYPKKIFSREKPVDNTDKISECEDSVKI